MYSEKRDHNYDLISSALKLSKVVLIWEKLGTSFLLSSTHLQINFRLTEAEHGLDRFRVEILT